MNVVEEAPQKCHGFQKDKTELPRDLSYLLTSHWNLHSARSSTWTWSSVPGSWQSLKALSAHMQSRPSLVPPPKALQCEFSEYTRVMAALNRKD